MNKKSIIIILGLIILSVFLFLFFNQNEPATAVDYVNDKYGFALTLDEDFNENVEIIEEDQVFYFVSKEIQATQPGMILGVVGRIEIYNKTEFTEETMMESGDAYGLKYLGENDRYYFGWAHATDVQVPPGEESLTETFRALEADFAEIIKTFKTMDALAPEVKTDTGRYVGLADNNFFEVKISGVPDDKASRVFMISDKVRSKFESLNLQGDEEIKLQYVENEHGQNIVEDINRILEYKKISAKEAKAIIDSEDGIIILDVRTVAEYSEGFIEGALNIPNETITTDSEPELLPNKNAKILVYCRSGNRSQQASQKLIDMGYSQVYDFGGIQDWPYGTVK